MNNYTLLPCSSVAKLQFFFGRTSRKGIFRAFCCTFSLFSSEITIREGMHYGMIMLFFGGAREYREARGGARESRYSRESRGSSFGAFFFGGGVGLLVVERVFGVGTAAYRDLFLQGLVLTGNGLTRAGRKCAPKQWALGRKRVVTIFPYWER